MFKYTKKFCQFLFAIFTVLVIVKKECKRLLRWTYTKNTFPAWCTFLIEISELGFCLFFHQTVVSQMKTRTTSLSNGPRNHSQTVCGPLVKEVGHLCYSSLKYRLPRWLCALLPWKWSAYNTPFLQFLEEQEKVSFAERRDWITTPKHKLLRNNVLWPLRFNDRKINDAGSLKIPPSKGLKRKFFVESPSFRQASIIAVLSQKIVLDDRR